MSTSLRKILDRECNFLSDEDYLLLTTLIVDYLKYGTVDTNSYITANRRIKLKNGRTIQFVAQFIMGEDKNGPYTIHNELAYLTLDLITGNKKFTPLNWTSDEEKLNVAQQLSSETIDNIVLDAFLKKTNNKQEPTI